jgi:hypothetical protein
MIMVLTALGGVSLNAQTTSGSSKQNYLFVDFAPLLVGLIGGGFGTGVGYERAVIKHFSIAGYFDYITLDGASGFDVLVRPRLYPFGSTVNRLFIGGILGYGSGEIRNYYYYYSEWESFSVFTYGVEAGWKFVFGSGFAIEPWLGYTFSEYGVTLGYAWGGGASSPRSRNSSGSR